VLFEVGGSVGEGALRVEERGHVVRLEVGTEERVNSAQVDRHGVDLALARGEHTMPIAVELGKAVDVVPGVVVGAVEDVAAVLVNRDVGVFVVVAVAVAADVRASVDHHDGLSVFLCLLGKDGAEQTAAYNEIVIHYASPFVAEPLARFAGLGAPARVRISFETLKSVVAAIVVHEDLVGAGGDGFAGHVVGEVASADLGEIAEVPSDGNVGFARNEDVGLGADVSHVGFDEQAAHEDRLEVASAEFAVAEGANADASAAHLLVVAVLVGAFVGDVDVVALVGEGFEGVVDRDAEGVDPGFGLAGGAAHHVYGLIGFRGGLGSAEEVGDLSVEGDVIAEDDFVHLLGRDDARVGNGIVGERVAVQARDVVG
jgi:hypothetical protein